jgi:hypothetical protein
VTICASHHHAGNVAMSVTRTLNLAVQGQNSRHKLSNLSACEALDTSFISMSPLKCMACLSFAVDYVTYFDVCYSRKCFELQRYFVMTLTIKQEHGIAKCLNNRYIIQFMGEMK